MKTRPLIVIAVAVVLVFFWASTSDEDDSLEQFTRAWCPDGTPECEAAMLMHFEACNDAFWKPMFDTHQEMLAKYGEGPDFEKEYRKYSVEYSENAFPAIKQCISDRSGYTFK